MTTPVVPAIARALALAVPAGAMATALIAQYVYNLAPCEMCWWQRYAHIAALVAGLAAWALRDAGVVRSAVWLAAAGIAASGAIGAFHAGVEYHWWQGFTACTTTHISGDPLAAIMAAPIVRCDVPAWTFAGISMAGFNAIGSLGAAALIAVLMQRQKGRA